MSDYCPNLTILKAQQDFLWWGMYCAFQQFPTLPAFSQQLPLSPALLEENQDL